MRTQLQSCIVSNLLLYIKRQVKFSRNLPWRLLIPRLKNLITENAWRLCNGHDFCLISGDQSHRASRSYCWEGSVLSWRRCCFKNKTADQPDWRYVAYVSFCLLHICGNRRISSLITDFFFLVPFFFQKTTIGKKKWTLTCSLQYISINTAWIKTPKMLAEVRTFMILILVQTLLFTVNDLHDKLRPPSIQTRYLFYAVLRFS